MSDLQKRVLESETALLQKEEENTALREQLRQFEEKWSEYEIKMKSMEETWQKQMSSLQVSSSYLKLILDTKIMKCSNFGFFCLSSDESSRC